MSNMSYCRFRNTLGDLQDCLYAMEDREEMLDISEEEVYARTALVKLCQSIVELSEIDDFPTKEEREAFRRGELEEEEED